MPGSVASLDDFWALLSNARDGYREFPSERFNWKAFYHPSQTRRDAINVKDGYFLDGDVSAFDAPFFRMNATDATSFVSFVLFCCGCLLYAFVLLGCVGIGWECGVKKDWIG